jgi:hypothetical protein
MEKINYEYYTQYQSATYYYFAGSSDRSCRATHSWNRLRFASEGWHDGKRNDDGHEWTDHERYDGGLHRDDAELSKSLNLSSEITTLEQTKRTHR